MRLIKVTAFNGGTEAQVVSEKAMKHLPDFPNVKSFLAQQTEGARLDVQGVTYFWTNEELLYFCVVLPDDDTGKRLHMVCQFEVRVLCGKQRLMGSERMKALAAMKRFLAEAQVGESLVVGHLVFFVPFGFERPQEVEELHLEPVLVESVRSGRTCAHFENEETVEAVWKNWK